MKHAFYDTSLGKLHIGYNNNTLLLLELENVISNTDEKNKFTDSIFNQVCEYLNGKRKIFDIKYKFNGTDFQNKVWHELEKIPYGETRTYGQIAFYIDNPKSCRAVGGACNKNPLWLVVPCHRVIGSNGSLTGYAEGLSVKETLLNIEKFVCEQG